MGRKPKISEFRERMDKTLASHNLANEESIKTLVKNQLLRSSPSKINGFIENIVERRTVEVSNFLDMLRSSSRNDSDVSKNHDTPHADWKLKHDNEEFRVMYREGIQGTPFHTLLVEGYVDAPVDACLCVSWESTLYNKWWPQFSIPTFKITSSDCLQKVQIGEQISLVRVKVSWPLSAREAVLHYFELEYSEDDLIIVLINTVSDLNSVDRSTHGFTNDGIPEAKDIVRIDLVGGFALQKVTSDRSYFRTIMTMDIKLDFVPPSFINFMSRQLIGNGFKLYQKAVASVAKGDEDFGKALEDPLYTRIREGINPSNKLNKALEPEDLKSEKSACILPEEHPVDSLQAQVIDQKSVCEIEEEEIDQDTEDDSENIDHSPTNQVAVQHHVSKENKVFISPEVENALGILEKAISIVRMGGSSAQTWCRSGSTNQDFLNLENVADTTNEDGVCSGGGVCVEAPKMDSMDRSLDESMNGSGIQNSRHMGPDSSLREVNHNQITPATAEQNFPISSTTQQVAFCSSEAGTTTEAPVLDDMNKDYKQVSVKENGNLENSFNGERKKLRQHEKKQWLCCLHFISGRA
ncbi:hypothetical protein HHK36_017966 [Tetracentron sinense]|uniref:Uncharacterized protein n=1 Tax=Tetracentron sinense TaxID=13715 RepID=A0A835DDK0_TETSI|nr:hypothetical protein HHK36_017966 [Tetracentron sinense]